MFLRISFAVESILCNIFDIGSTGYVGCNESRMEYYISFHDIMTALDFDLINGRYPWISSICI